MKKIDKNLTKKLFDDSMINYDDAKLDEFIFEENKILNEIEKLKNINVENLEPAHYCVDFINTYLRDDNEEQINISKDAILKNAPENDENYITIVKVVE